MKQYESVWRIYGKKADFEANARRFGISPYTARIIRNRDVIEEEDIRTYLLDGFEKMTTWQAFAPYLHNPWQMKDMWSACSILLEAIAAKRHIRIIGDYDIDGVTSIYILYTALRRLTPDVDWRIPDRMKDGYGLNDSFVREAVTDGIDVLVTCDNGIAAADAITLAKMLKPGMKIVVTDHHDVPVNETEQGAEEILPPADAIVNPKQRECGYPFPKICGAVVAWKLVTCLYESYARTSQTMHVEEAVPEEELQRALYEYIPFAAIATIGDVMELVGENRLIAKMGLYMIHQTKHVGLRALLKVQKVVPQAVRAYHVGFVIGPVINAGGRLDTARRAVELLMCQNEEEAQRIAEELKKLNDVRKDMTAESVKRALELVERLHQNDRVLVIYDRECHESIAGIVAGRVREVYNRPTIVLTDDQSGGVKGSGRSIPAYHMFEQLQRCRELLTKFGGHPMAAGLSLEKGNVDILRRRLNEQCVLTAEDLKLTQWIDIPLPPQRITFPFVRELERLEPFGNGNSKPVFAVKNVRVSKAAVFGKNQNALKLSLIIDRGDEVRDSLAGTNRDADGGNPCISSPSLIMDGVYFGDVEGFLEYYRRKYSEEEVQRMTEGQPNAIEMSLMYYPSINEFRGRQLLQLVISDFC